MPKHERLNRGWLKIGELARKLGLPVTTIRHYSEIGLLPVTAETRGGYRLFDIEQAVSRIGQIRQIKGGKTTLRETREIIEKGQFGNELLVA